MCYIYPHFAPQNQREVSKCANGQIAAESRRLSFALWVLVKLCPDGKLSGLRASDRRAIEKLVERGFERKPIEHRLSTITTLIHKLGGELALSAVPHHLVLTEEPVVKTRLSESVRVEIPAMFHQLYWSLIGPDYGENEPTVEDCATLAEMSGLCIGTVRAAFSGSKQCKFRTLMLLSTAMWHRVFFEIRRNGGMIGAKATKKQHDDYVEDMKANGGKFRIVR